MVRRVRAAPARPRRAPGAHRRRLARTEPARTGGIREARLQGRDLPARRGLPPAPELARPAEGSPHRLRGLGRRPRAPRGEGPGRTLQLRDARLLVDDGAAAPPRPSKPGEPPAPVLDVRRALVSNGHRRIFRRRRRGLDAHGPRSGRVGFRASRAVRPQDLIPYSRRGGDAQGGRAGGLRRPRGPRARQPREVQGHGEAARRRAAGLRARGVGDGRAARRARALLRRDAVGRRPGASPGLRHREARRLDVVRREVEESSPRHDAAGEARASSGDTGGEPPGGRGRVRRQLPRRRGGREVLPRGLGGRQARGLGLGPGLEQRQTRLRGAAPRSASRLPRSVRDNIPSSACRRSWRSPPRVSTASSPGKGRT